ncbi:MAG TPA: PAS domain-containing protein [Baekduia sp.]|nr:PAS domain-containing protein [Baekduia sp.]
MTESTVAGRAPRRKIEPNNRERSFSLDELFFSTTDRKGVIRTCNDVFVRVSGMERSELIGHAHNVVRHPGMPRSVFRLFWDALEARRSIAAYVMNLAADGSHYWVMASAAPVGEGYVSVRLKPTAEHFAVAREIYADVRAVEQRIEGSDPRKRKEAIAAGAERLSELLAQAGYPTYDDFMNAALPAEVTGREAALRGTERRDLAQVPADAPAALAGILRSCSAATGFLDGMVANLDRFRRLGEELAGRSQLVAELAGDIRLFSLNAIVASARLGGDGAPLGVVAGELRSCSDHAGPVIEELRGDIGETVRVLGDLGFRTAAARLQTEMVATFVQDVLAEGAGADTVVEELNVLATCLDEGFARLLQARTALDERVGTLSGNVRRVEGDLGVLRALEINGRVEAARLGDTASVEALFHTIAEQVGAARRDMAGFAEVSTLAAERDARAERRAQEQVRALARHAQAVAA